VESQPREESGGVDDGLERVTSRPARRSMRFIIQHIGRDGVGWNGKRSVLPVINWTVVIVDVEEHDEEEELQSLTSQRPSLLRRRQQPAVGPTTTGSTRSTSKARSSALHPFSLVRCSCPLPLGSHRPFLVAHPCRAVHSTVTQC
jgi:hypothetical protein